MYLPVLIGRIFAVDGIENDTKFVAASGFFTSGLFEGTVTVWGWEWVSVVCIGVPRKSREMLGNFILSEE